jgi:hypothetical protein
MLEFSHFGVQTQIVTGAGRNGKPGKSTLLQPLTAPYFYSFFPLSSTHRNTSVWQRLPFAVKEIKAINSRFIFKRVKNRAFSMRRCCVTQLPLPVVTNTANKKRRAKTRLSHKLQSNDYSE